MSLSVKYCFICAIVITGSRVRDDLEVASETWWVGAGVGWFCWSREKAFGLKL